eukprot:jgi/Mesen1/2015/ME000148S01116
MTGGNFVVHDPSLQGTAVAAANGLGGGLTVPAPGFFEPVQIVHAVEASAQAPTVELSISELGTDVANKLSLPNEASVPPALGNRGGTEQVGQGGVSQTRTENIGNCTEIVRHTQAFSLDGKGKGDSDRKEKGKKQKTVPFWRLFTYADKLDYFLMVVGTLGAMALGIAMPLLSLLFGQLSDAFGNSVTTSEADIVKSVTEVALRFVYVAIGAAIAAYLVWTLGGGVEMACWMLTGERQSARIREMFLRATLRQDISFFDLETSTGEVVGRMSGDIFLVQEAMGEKVGNYIRLMTTFFGGFAIAFARGWLLSLVMLSSVPLLVVCGGVMSWVISKAATKGQEAYAEAGGLAEQCISAIRTVASFAGEARAEKEYSRSLDKAFGMGVRQGVASGAGLGVTMLVMFSTYALALWYGSLLVANSGYSGGNVMSVLFAIIIGGMALGQASPALGAFAAGQAAAYTIFQVIDRVPPIDSFALSGATPASVKGDLEFEHVRFAYPARPDVHIFDDFSLRIESGQTVALVGESGSGKSTVVSLLERFYDPIDGKVTLDGCDIKSLQLRWLRQQMGLVSQEPVLFGTSIRDNIAYGKEGGATDAEIVEAARSANVYSFISQLPHGFDTEVGERGAQLSGGQKQRIAIARAILKNPRILLLDEATSALDAESEKVVQEALERVMQGRTTVVIAHRLTTIRNASKIAVLQRGVIVETGTHAELVQKPGGAYAQLVHIQQVQRSESVKKPPIDRAASSIILRSNREEGQASPTSRRSTDSPGSGRESCSGRRRSGGIFGLQLRRPSQDGAPARVPAPANADGDEEAIGDGNGTSTRVDVNVGGPAGLVRKLASVVGAGRRRSKVRSGDLEAGRGRQQAAPQVSVWRLAKLNAPEWPYALLGTVAGSGQGLMFPIFSILLSSIISTFYIPDVHRMRDRANFWASMFLVLAAATMVLIAFQMSMFAIVGSHLVRRVRALTFGAVLRQEMAFFDDNVNSSGAIGARLSTDAAQVRAMVGDRVALLVQNVATILAGLVIAFRANWQLSLVVMAVVPLLGLSGYIQTLFLQGFSANAKVMYEDASRVANDAVSSIRTVAAFCAERQVLALYADKCSMPLRAGIRRGQASGLGLGFSNFCMFAVYGLAFWYGAKLVQRGDATFKDVFNVFFAIVMSAMGVSQSLSLAPDFTTVQLAVNSIFAIIDRKSKIDPEAPGDVLPAVKGQIELRHVKFRYPTRPDVKIFNDLCLTIPAGQTVALVGESGSGKSTVVALIERFYDPLRGAVFIDGVDITKLQLKWLRQQMGLVSQEPVLFNMSIRANIAYGRVGASEQEIVAAAIDANAHKFISGLPEGYDTLVGERGVQLSGGQKQRVAIARAIVKDPKILLLDEATSALDTESEHVVQEALDRVMVGRTTVVIAHRLSTIRNADAIAVVQRGTLVEQGTHEELLQVEGGVYCALVRLYQHTDPAT